MSSTYSNAGRPVPPHGSGGGSTIHAGETASVTGDLTSHQFSMTKGTGDGQSMTVTLTRSTSEDLLTPVQRAIVRRHKGSQPDRYSRRRNRY